MSIFAQGKVLSHIEKIAKWKMGEVVYPVQIELGTTNVCNNKCPFCCGYKDRIENSDTLSKEKVEELLKDAFDCGVKSITFTGDGEPTCHPDWWHFVKYAHDLGMDVGLITNGLVKFESAVPYCDWIRISIDASTPETYHKQHGVNTFYKVLENVKDAIDYKQLGRYNCTIGVGFLTCRQANAEIISFAKLMKEYQVDYVQFRPLLSVFGQDWFSDTHETIETIKKAQEINNKVVFSEAKYLGLLEGHYGQTDKCYGWIFETAISADGGIYRCCHYKGIKSQKLGDILNKSFKDEWKRIVTDSKPFKTLPSCPKFCRHYSNNRPMEQMFEQKEHPNFI